MGWRGKEGWERREEIGGRGKRLKSENTLNVHAVRFLKQGWPA
jgi:hypothetical protein